MTFRIVVFRPFRGEVIEGWIRELKPEGVYGTSHVEFRLYIVQSGPNIYFTGTDFLILIFEPPLSKCIINHSNLPVSLGFFDDILIPAVNLFETSEL